MGSTMRPCAVISSSIFCMTSAKCCRRIFCSSVILFIICCRISGLSQSMDCPVSMTPSRMAIGAMMTIMIPSMIPPTIFSSLLSVKTVIATFAATGIAIAITILSYENPTKNTCKAQVSFGKLLFLGFRFFGLNDGNGRLAAFHILFFSQLLCVLQDSNRIGHGIEQRGVHPLIISHKRSSSLCDDYPWASQHSTMNFPKVKQKHQKLSVRTYFCAICRPLFRTAPLCTSAQ